MIRSNVTGVWFVWNGSSHLSKISTLLTDSSSFVITRSSIFAVGLIELPVGFIFI